MLEHVIFSVSNLSPAVRFYDSEFNTRFTLTERTGIQILKGFGREGRAFFWLKLGVSCPEAVHIGFMAESRGRVDAFYEAAIRAGARDNISPRIRSEDDRLYYAEILDPDGYSIEIVIKATLLKIDFPSNFGRVEARDDGFES